MASPSLISNPADKMVAGSGWFIDTGLPFIDSRARLVSGELHFIAGDPGAGKTTMAIHLAMHNAMKGRPVYYVGAETDEVEIALGLLTSTRLIDSRTLLSIRYDPTQRTKKNVDMIHDLWEERFSGIPVYFIRCDHGPEELIPTLEKVEKALVIVDHAFAVVNQSHSLIRKEHQSFMALFTALKRIALDKDNVMVVLNQYKLSGRKGDERGPDAEYGGSGVRNIAGSMLHIRKPSDDISPHGYDMLYAVYHKMRAMLVADEHGDMVNPIGDEFSFFIENRYRLIVDKPPGFF